MLLNNKFLVADIGGTRTRFAIITRSLKIIFKKEYKSNTGESFDYILKDFLSLCGAKPDIACFAVAGPLNQDRNHALLTNVSWEIDAKELQQKYKFKKVVLLNDFEALGLSIDHINNTQYTELTMKGIDNKGITSIIGAGTGLGTSILYLSYGRHYPISSEGGHTDLPINPSNKIELALYNYLKKNKKVLEIESVVSGKGLVNIYEFMYTQKIKHNSKIHSEIIHAHHDEKPALITKYALQDKDLLCIKVLELFITFYARVARNLVLLTLSSNLIIAGGIAPKILPALQDMFLEAFTVHEQAFIQKLLENITIIVITDPDMAFYGCANALMT